MGKLVFTKDTIYLLDQVILTLVV